MPGASEIDKSRLARDKAGQSRTEQAGRQAGRQRHSANTTRTCVALAGGGRGLLRERVVRVQRAVGACGGARGRLVLAR
jgi:hypothetical protein